MVIEPDDLILSNVGEAAKQAELMPTNRAGMMAVYKFGVFFMSVILVLDRLSSFNNALTKC